MGHRALEAVANMVVTKIVLKREFLQSKGCISQRHKQMQWGGQRSARSRNSILTEARRAHSSHFFRVLLRPYVNATTV